MAGSDLKWFPIASEFPAGLDTETDPKRLRDGFSPDAYGMNIDYPGRLVKATLTPTFVLPIVKQYVIGANTWTWYYRRLWRAANNNLHYCAKEYVAIEYPQDLGILSFDEEGSGSVIQGFFPFARDAMFVTKENGGYIVPNANSDGGRFEHGPIHGNLRSTTSGNSLMLNQIAYVSNEYGFMAWDGNVPTELTRNCRTASTRFTNKALRLQWSKNRVIGFTDATDTFVYDADTKKLFYWLAGTTSVNGTANPSFRFTTRTITNKAYEPFRVASVAFHIVNTTEKSGTISYQYKTDQDWSAVQTVQVRWDEKGRHWTANPMERALESRNFTVRVTDISSHIHIRQIDILASLTSEVESLSE